MFNSMKYAVKQAFKQVGRNRAMSLASIFSITAMLLILGLFFVMLVNLQMAMERATEDYDTVQVYLLEETTYEQAQTMIATISGLDGVESATYLTKEDALVQWRADWADKAYMLDSLPENPLPNSIIVTVSQLDAADGIVEKLKTYEGIEDIKYYKETVDTLMQVTNSMKIASLVIMAFLVLICVVVVSNTIKLTVLARVREINIMKYVGATNWFIRGPFLVEGILIGIISAGISSGIVALVYDKLEELIGPFMFQILSTPMVSMEFLIFNLAWIFIALGVSIGAWGSIISMRRFLDT